MCRGYGQVVKGTGFRDVGVQTYSTTARVQSRKLGISVIVARKLSPSYVTSICACKAFIAEKCLVPGTVRDILRIRIRPSYLIMIWIQLWIRPQNKAEETKVTLNDSSKISSPIFCKRIWSLYNIKLPQIKCCGTGSAWIRIIFGSWIQIRIRNVAQINIFMS